VCENPYVQPWEIVSTPAPVTTPDPVTAPDPAFQPQGRCSDGQQMGRNGCGGTTPAVQATVKDADGAPYNEFSSVTAVRAVPRSPPHSTNALRLIIYNRL
jgi:hypothetical protein